MLIVELSRIIIHMQLFRVGEEEEEWGKEPLFLLKRDENGIGGIHFSKWVSYK